MLNYERMWFKLKKHILEKDIPDLAKVLAKIELEEYEAQGQQPKVTLTPGSVPGFVPVDRITPVYGINAPIVTMYAVAPVDVDPFTGNFRAGASSTITTNSEKDEK